MKKCDTCLIEKTEDEFRILKTCKKCYKQRERAAKRTKIEKIKQRIEEKKVLMGCCICNWNKFASGLDLHHIDPEEKSFTISSILSSGGRDCVFSSLYKEFAKCCVICANCHRGVHSQDISLTMNPPRFSIEN